MAMEYIADLHLHSKYSRAVSPQMVIPEIAKWAKRKGIDLVGAPDWTHPLFFRELKDELVEAGEGIYAAKDDPKGPKFILATEISSIYSQGGRGRRIHNLVLSPSLETAEKISTALRNRGANLLSDGRPIIGLSARELTQLVLETDKNCLIVPCHVWTPYFALYGSKSGFDSIDECFGEMGEGVFAVETGLSSSPEMNWRIKELDNRRIVSFSDAHSPTKLGREVTVFEVSDQSSVISYQQIREAIIPSSSPGSRSSRITYTVEFYPEEGKYHWTGHRNCNVKQSPEETKKLGVTCPTCGRMLTVGVMHRVEQLASRRPQIQNQQGKTGLKWVQTENRPSYVMMVPLLEILAESLGSGPASLTVQNEYRRLTDNFGTEFAVLLKTPLEEIIKLSGEKVGEAVKKVRAGDISVDPGFDGEFGKVKIWPDEGKKVAEKKQMSLF